MFEQLLEAMPRFEFYLSCLQGDPAIERDIVEIYREFMIFALKAVKLFGSQRRISITCLPPLLQFLYGLTDSVRYSVQACLDPKAERL